ncbi:MAG: PCMD domain-containing protein [Bacteroidales bacterium]
MINPIYIRLLLLVLLLAENGLEICAKPKPKLLPYGDMNQWITRQIKESAIIGGNIKEVYEIGPPQTISGATPYTNQGGSLWATSNVLAKMAGVVKTNTSVFPEKRDDGYCVRLETRLESVKVLGLLDITVLAAGSLFLGTVHEPISSMKQPYKMLQMGVPFTKRPTALQYDYKIKISDAPKRIKATGFSAITDISGKDYIATILTLQKRWEDKEGNILAKRIGTLVVHYDKTIPDWQNNTNYQILYGDISQHPSYDPKTMGLNANERFTMNSKNESVAINEIAWGAPNEKPTHLILQFTSSHGGAYIGSPGNTFWVDNVKFIY